MDVQCTPLICSFSQYFYFCCFSSPPFPYPNCDAGVKLFVADCWSLKAGFSQIRQLLVTTPAQMVPGQEPTIALLKITLILP